MRHGLSAALVRCGSGRVRRSRAAHRRSSRRLFRQRRLRPGGRVRHARSRVRVGGSARESDLAAGARRSSAARHLPPCDAGGVAQVRRSYDFVAAVVHAGTGQDCRGPESERGQAGNVRRADRAGAPGHRHAAQAGLRAGRRFLRAMAAKRGTLAWRLLLGRHHGQSCRAMGQPQSHAARPRRLRRHQRDGPGGGAAPLRLRRPRRGGFRARPLFAAQGRRRAWDRPRQPDPGRRRRGRPHAYRPAARDAGRPAPSQHPPDGNRRHRRHD